MTQTQLSIIVGVGLTAVEKNIRFLKENGYIVRIGSNKTGYWKVKIDKWDGKSEKEFNSGQDIKTRRTEADNKIAPKTRIKTPPKIKRAE